MWRQPSDGDPYAIARLRAAFERDLSPMLLVDDDRRYVAANASACDLLELAPQQVAWHRIDDFTGPQDAARLAEQWAAFLHDGGLEGLLQLNLPTGSLVPIEVGATANVVPGRHLLVVIPRAGSEPDEEAPAGSWVRLVPGDADQPPLTAREQEILTLTAAGLQGGAIADYLVVSPETVKTHMQNTMAKLGARTRAHAVAIALSTGQIELHDDAPGIDLRRRG